MAPPSAEVAQQRAAVLAGLPDPPPGFTWVIYRNAAIAKPVGWHERSSPEDFSETKQFLMGYTVQIISHPRARHGIEPGDAAKMYLTPFIEAHKQKDQVLLFDQREKDAFQMIVFRYRDAPPNKTPIIVHKLLVVNPVADSVHAFTFESPEATWQENWEKYGTPILSRVAVFPRLPSED